MATCSFEDTIGFLEKEQKSEPPKLSFHAVMTACLQGRTHGHSKRHQYLSYSYWLAPKTLKASWKNVEQLQRKRMDGMVENTYSGKPRAAFPRSRRVEAKSVGTGGKKTLENSKTHMK